MSRVGEAEYEPTIDSRGREINTTGLWRGALAQALKSKRGQQALRDLRDALMALPERRLIEGALCTVGLADRIEAMPRKVIRDVTPYDRTTKTYGPAVPTEVDNWERKSLIEFVDEHDDQGEGVCAVGAFVWWAKVRAGVEAREAFAALPVLPDTDGDIWETASAGRDAGLTETLAWRLAYLNDEHCEGMSPEDRWQWFVDWIDRTLADPVANG